MFSLLHIVLIVFSFISIPLLSFYITQKGQEFVKLVLKIIAFLILFFDPAYWVWEYLTFGYFRWESTLPLYLCSLFWILMPFVAFYKEGQIKQTAMACLATIGLISGIMGFVFNYHIDVYPIVSFVGIRTLLYHYLMMFVAVLLWISKEYKPQVGDQIRAFIPIIIILIPGIILNLMYGYDYGYTAGGKGTLFTILSDRLPIPIFLVVVYGVMFLLVWIIFYYKVPLFKKEKAN